MNAQSPMPETLTVSPGARISAADVDRSCRIPILLLLTSSVAWLVIGIFLGLLSSIKLHGPGFLAGGEWLTYGRVYPASRAALAYGFASQAGLALTLWMIARLGRTRLLGTALTTLAGLFWNASVAIGIAGILAGQNTGYEWFEMPGYAAPILFAAYVVIGVYALIAFHQRCDRSLYVSQWYLLAALLWFPWIYSTAHLLLIQWPVRGVMQEVISNWYSHNLFTLWLTPISLAAIFYFIPKLLARPLHSQYLAMFGFWTLAFFGGWGELQAGAPIPKWISSLSAVANVLLLIPLLAVAINWHHTVAGRYGAAWSNPVLRFILFGAASYVGASLLQILGSFRSVSEVTGLTYYDPGVRELYLFGFVGMTIAAAIWHLVPRITESEWPSASFTRLYFWLAGTGTVISALSLVLGGIVQGLGISDASSGFLDVMRRTVPFVGMNTLGGLLLLAANLSLFVSLGKHLSRCCGCCGMTLAVQNRAVMVGRRS